MRCVTVNTLEVAAEYSLNSFQTNYTFLSSYSDSTKSIDNIVYLHVHSLVVWIETSAHIERLEQHKNH